jgi:hypothetical protein
MQNRNLTGPGQPVAQNLRDVNVTKNGTGFRHVFVRNFSHVEDASLFQYCKRPLFSLIYARRTKLK